ncbi:hypothetical protein V2J91_12420 [Pseudomonas alliivorans]|nr:hypothetical protein [Pseudomonas alliivorans]MEE5146888.1 hypothetical protein [Pseudomonas alliivorans]
MNFYIYRDLNVEEKKAIAFFMLFSLMSIILIAVTLPENSNDCLKSVPHGRDIAIIIKQECASKIMNAIDFSSQLRHIAIGAMASIFVYLVIFHIFKFCTWVKRRPND